MKGGLVQPPLKPMKKIRLICLTCLSITLLTLFAVVPGGSVHVARATSCTYDMDAYTLTTGGIFELYRDVPNGDYGVYYPTGGPTGNQAVYNDRHVYTSGPNDAYVAAVRFNLPGGSAHITSLSASYKSDAANQNAFSLYFYDLDNNTPYFSTFTQDNAWHTTTQSVSITTAHILFVADQNVGTTSGFSMSHQSAVASFSITFDCASFTPTPSPSPTPTSPAYSGGSFMGQCPLLGDSNAIFLNLPGNWTINPTTITNPSGSQFGLHWTSLGYAAMVLHISRYHKYIITVKFHLVDTASSIDHFSTTLGGSTSLPIPVTLGSTDEQTFTSDIANYIPDPDQPEDSDLYTFRLSYGVGDNVDWIVDLACVSDATPGAQIVPSGGSNSAGICRDCTYHATGNLINDILSVFAWLWCGLSQLFDCVLKPMLLGIWQVILNVLQVLGFVRIWAGTIIGNGIRWLNANWGVIGAWASGALSNLVRALLNVATFLLNTIPIVGFINLILSFFGTPLGQLVANTAHTAGTVIATGADIIQIGANFLGQVVTGIISIIGAIPTVIAAIIAGFNSPSTSIPVYAPSCSATNTLLFYPCLGSYILDNTLLDGPVYLMFILMLGLVALNVLLWAVRAVQEALGK